MLEHAASIGRLRKGRLEEVVESPLAWFRLDVATVVEVVVALANAVRRELRWIIVRWTLAA